MLCPVCHSYYKNDNEQMFGILIRAGSGDLAIILCTARNQFNQMSGLRFNAHGRRYAVDVFRGHSTTLIGGDDWAKFKPDFNQITGSPEQDLDEGDVVGEGGSGAFAVVREEEVINPGHGLGAALDIISTRVVVLNDGERQMLGLIHIIQDGYIGPHFVHRLTPTNITNKLMFQPDFPCDVIEVAAAEL